MSGTFQSSGFRRQVEGVDLDELLEIAAELTAREPHSRAELSRALAPRWPDADCGFARLRGDVPPAARAGAPARGVGEDGRREVAERREGAWRAGRVGRRPGRGRLEVSACVRAGGAEGPAGVVQPDRPSRGDRRPAARSFASFVPRRARSSTTSRTGSSPIPKRPRRCASCPSTTTRSSASRTAAGSRRRPKESGRTGRARSWWTGSRAGTWRFDRGGKRPRSRSAPWRKLTRARAREVEAEATALLEWAELETEVRSRARSTAE